MIIIITVVALVLAAVSLALAASLVVNGVLLAALAFMVLLLVVDSRSDGDAPNGRQPRATVRPWPPVGEA